ncbi:MAG: hypothetical protein AAFY26_08385 [Cyanobacteria bacterium J06638_22]
MQSSFNSTNENLLANLWAKKYLKQLASNEETSHRSLPLSDRHQIAKRLMERLRFSSSQAWTKTEALLVKELPKHRLDINSINPWKISEDSHKLFEQACESYQRQMTPEQFSVIISPQCGQLRQQHTTMDPRLQGFLSMQFHYTGKFLLEELPPVERVLVADYFKVMDDHLYMPLQRLYDAAAQLPYQAQALVATRELLPLSTQIAEFICAQVAESNPTYRCNSGRLNAPEVRTSSIRDIEMFQIYLCLCVLENNIASIQQELFPLCVMLYPPLNVRWSLVRQLVTGLTHELQTRLTPASFSVFIPYLHSLHGLFSEEVFPETETIRLTAQSSDRPFVDYPPLAS